MADATGSNYYKRSLTEYEVEACKRDAAKRAQGCDECSLTEHEVNPYDQQSETYSHIFTAATAMAAKIERRAELDAEITALEAEIAAAKTKHADTLAAKDAEIAALEAELAAHRA
jgi:septal ring factor EnvC (AmiA/AmiB activator)